MAEETIQAGSEAQAPPSDQNVDWNEAAVIAASTLLQDQLGIEATPEYVDAVLEAALWRKSCHALLTALSAIPLPESIDEARALLADVPEAAFLGILALNSERAGIYLGRACVSYSQEARLLQLAKAIEDILAANAAALNANLLGLGTALSQKDIYAAAADPAFLLYVVMQIGSTAQQDEARDDTADELLRAMRLTVNEASRAAAASLLAEQGNPEGAVVFRLLHQVARAARSALAGQPSSWDIPAIDAVLQGMDRAEAGLLAEPSRLSDYAAYQKVAMLSMLAMDPGLRADDRRRYYDSARQSLDGLYARLQASGQALNVTLNQEAGFVWAAAELETGQLRAERRVAAITRLHELLAMAALEGDTTRLSSMVTVSTTLSTAYYETGHFTAAIDQAIMARHLARVASDRFTELVDASEEVESEWVRVGRSMVALAERTYMIARARLAESRGDFDDASRLYGEAAQVESRLKDSVREVLSVLFGDAGKGAPVNQRFESEARAAHFAGMAAINRADAALMEGDQPGARTGYQDARGKLEHAAALWEAERARPGPQANEAARQAQVSTLRARYCDCKMDFAQAERLIALRDHLGAAQKFIAAGTVLRELVERSLDVDEDRNQQILVGSGFYAHARSLFELDLDSRSDENLHEARQRMAEAANKFVSVGEARWAAFIRAQSAECEAQVLQRKAEGSAADPAREVLLSRASDRRQDAADFYAQADTLLEGAPRQNTPAGPRLLVLPKPQAPIGHAETGLAVPVGPLRDNRRTAKIARMRALEETINELKRVALLVDYREQLISEWRESMETIRVLFVSANPVGTVPLKLDEEVREIEAKIRAAEHRDSLELITKWAARPDDLLQSLNEHKPHVVHFSGHGSSTEEIILLDRLGEPKPVSTDALVALFRVLKDNIRVVLLNACFSRAQAEAITGEIDCAIGMTRAIGDNAAIIFAASFYRALGFGRSVKDAFDQGKTALLLEGIREEQTPTLMTHQNMAAESIFLINPQ
jgi:hypothetical protein